MSRSSMPDGFFFRDILWFGDSASPQTAVARGFVVEPAELDALDEEAKADLMDRLRVLLITLGQPYTLQVGFQVGKAYFAELERLKKRPKRSRISGATAGRFGTEPSATSGTARPWRKGA